MKYGAFHYHIFLFLSENMQKNIFLFIPAKQEVLVGGVVKVLAAVHYVAVSYLQVELNYNCTLMDET